MVELDQLRALSARVGADPLLVQAAGGNTSLKQDGVMWIKASGTWLKDAATRDIFVPLDHAAIMEALARNDPACESCTAFLRTDLNSTGLRPSIETTVHALMPQRVVLHVHCVNTIAWAIRADAEARLAEKLAGFNWAFIPYARPGLPLAGAIQSRIAPGRRRPHPRQPRPRRRGGERGGGRSPPRKSRHHPHPPGPPRSDARTAPPSKPSARTSPTSPP